MAGKAVWILNHYAVTPDLPGGTRHYDLARQLVARGYRVTVLASGFDHTTKSFLKLGSGERLRVEEWDGVRFVWLRTTPYSGNDWRRLLNMISYSVAALRAEGRLERPQVVLGSSPHPFAGLAAWWLARSLGAGFIFEVRDLWPQSAVDLGALRRDSLPASLLYAWERFMYRRAATIITVPPLAREYITRLGVPPEKVVWIPNGVDLERFDGADSLDPRGEHARALVEEHREKFKVMYAGSHGPANGLEVVVEAAALLAARAPQVHLFLVGDGPEKEGLVRRTRALGLANVTFLPAVPKAQVSSLLKQADLLLHCLRPLGVLRHGISPNKLYDYLAAGKPMLVATGAANDVVAEAGAGISVPPADPQALAEGILTLYRMAPEERQRLGANGRAYVEKHHDIRVLGQRLAELIEEVTGSVASP